MNSLAYDNTIRVIDSKALERRIRKDGRSMIKIADAAGISVETLRLMMKRGTATNWTINNVRMALNPRMHYSTISPESLQCKQGESVKSINNSEWQHQIAYCKALSKDFEDLCNKYSVVDVLDIANQVQMDIMRYLKDCGFDLLEIHDETLKNIPKIEGV